MTAEFRVVTERLMLRHLRNDDAAALAAYRSDPAQARYQSWETPYSETSARALIAEMRGVRFAQPGAWLQIGIETGGRLVGDVAVRVDGDEPRQATVGFTLAADAQGRGVATEAVRAIISRLFTEHGVHRVWADCDSRNDRSAALLERVGMRREAHHRRSAWWKGEWTDEYVYAVLAEEWRDPGDGSDRRPSPPGSRPRAVGLDRGADPPVSAGGGASERIGPMDHDLHFTGDAAADRLLSTDPLALLIGMLLDQQIAMETAFAGPAKLHERLGGIDAATLAGIDPDALTEVMRRTPAVHRYPGSMAKRIIALSAAIVEDYDGEASRIWTDGDPDGAEVLRRLKALPGFGEQKARIFLALLGKQCGLEAPGWREAAGSYGEEGARRSIADVVDEDTLLEVRETKRAAKAAAKKKS